jgi:hypothetical protein
MSYAKVWCGAVWSGGVGCGEVRCGLVCYGEVWQARLGAPSGAWGEYE